MVVPEAHLMLDRLVAVRWLVSFHGLADGGNIFDSLLPLIFEGSPFSHRRLVKFPNCQSKIKYSEFPRFCQFVSASPLAHWEQRALATTK